MKKQLKILLISVYLITIGNHVSARTYAADEAIKQYNVLKLRQPSIDSDGRIQTLNDKGAMAPAKDYATLQFINDSKGYKVLEIGGGYGLVMLETLHKNPNTEYHLNDLDARHLFIAAHNLYQSVENNLVLMSAAQKVKFIAGDITKEDFAVDEKYDAILIGRVLHFFSPAELEMTVANIKRVLKPNGKLYIVATSPYVKRFAKFIPEYEARLARGEKFPGFVKSLYDWVDKDQELSKYKVPPSHGHFMFLDDKIMRNLFESNGFNVLTCELQAYPSKASAWELDGRENVVLIAESNHQLH